jgi:hypothetical protein
MCQTMLVLLEGKAFKDKAIKKIQFLLLAGHQ